MKTIKAGYEILSMHDYAQALRLIELAGRTAYKSETEINVGTAEKFIRMIRDRKHDSVLEHVSFTVKFICDRGVSHEIVRHRIGISFTQESTRYCNYSKEKFGSQITCIDPLFFKDGSEQQSQWLSAMLECERVYFHLLEIGATPQEARSVLPNSLKTEIVVTANIRAWRHFFKLRTASTAHPQMREITIPLLNELKKRLPVFFEDIEVI